MAVYSYDPANYSQNGKDSVYISGNSSMFDDFLEASRECNLENGSEFNDLGTKFTYLANRIKKASDTIAVDNYHFIFSEPEKCRGYGGWIGTNIIKPYLTSSCYSDWIFHVKDVFRKKVIKTADIQQATSNSNTKCSDAKLISDVIAKLNRKAPYNNQSRAATSKRKDPNYALNMMLSSPRTTIVDTIGGLYYLCIAALLKTADDPENIKLQHCNINNFGILSYRKWGKRYSPTSKWMRHLTDEKYDKRFKKKKLLEYIQSLLTTTEINNARFFWCWQFKKIIRIDVNVSAPASPSEHPSVSMSDIDDNKNNDQSTIANNQNRDCTPELQLRSRSPLQSPLQSPLRSRSRSRSRSNSPIYTSIKNMSLVTFIARSVSNEAHKAQLIKGYKDFRSNLTRFWKDCQDFDFTIANTENGLIEEVNRLNRLNPIND